MKELIDVETRMEWLYTEVHGPLPDNFTMSFENAYEEDHEMILVITKDGALCTTKSMTELVFDYITCANKECL